MLAEKLKELYENFNEEHEEITQKFSEAQRNFDSLTTKEIAILSMSLESLKEKTISLFRINFELIEIGKMNEINRMIKKVENHVRKRTV